MKQVTGLPWIAESRRESGLIELHCKCGVGHPAPASVHWMHLHGQESMGVHGCCGCCNTTEWRLAAATRGYEVCNEILKQRQHVYKAAVRTIGELQETIAAQNKEIENLKRDRDGETLEHA